jgi:SAM-dependent methyltransferase
MKEEEYGNLERIERDHWFYAGKRSIVDYWIGKSRPLDHSDILLDYGAGTGFFAYQHRSLCTVKLADAYPASIDLLKLRFPADSVLAITGSRVDLPDASVSCITALDVLEHIKEDKATVDEFARLCTKGGLVVITVPAGMELWSDWDVSLMHFRRYSKASLLALFPEKQWDHIHCSYVNSFPYPVVYFLRKLRGLRGKCGSEATRAEDRVPWALLNWFFYKVFVATSTSSWFTPPFGVGLILVARRRS